jgi:hypothetical protein
MPRNLDELLDSVTDEPTFVAFLAALGEDFAAERMLESAQPIIPYSSGMLGWENNTVDGVFESAAAWAKDSANNPDLNPPGLNTWQRCARIVYAGKFYE